VKIYATKNKDILHHKASLKVTFLLNSDLDLDREPAC